MNVLTELTTVQECIDAMIIHYMMIQNNDYNENLTKVLTTLINLSLFCQMYDKTNFNTVNRLFCKSRCLINDDSILNEFAADVATIRYYFK